VQDRYGRLHRLDEHSGPAGSDELDVDRRVAAVENTEQVRKVEEPGGRDGADRQHPTQQTLHFVDGRSRRRGRVKCATRFDQQMAPGLGQLDEPRRTHGACRAELLLEKSDRSRPRRLSDVATSGRVGEVSLLRDGDEMFELSKLHWSPRPATRHTTTG
jgi:hypothetical protein